MVFLRDVISYADDTQFYIAVSPGETHSVDDLFNCILEIKTWMAENLLQLNQDKTEVLVICPEATVFKTKIPFFKSI